MLQPIQVIQAEEYTRPTLAMFDSVLQSARQTQDQVMRMQEFKLRAQQQISDRLEQQVAAIEFDNIETQNNLRELDFKRGTDAMNNQFKAALTEYQENQETNRNNYDGAVDLEVARLNYQGRIDSANIHNAGRIGAAQQISSRSNKDYTEVLKNNHVIKTNGKTYIIRRDDPEFANMTQSELLRDAQSGFLEAYAKDMDTALGETLYYVENKNNTIQTAKETFESSGFQDYLQFGRSKVYSEIPNAGKLSGAVDGFTYKAVLDAASQGNANAVEDLKNITIRNMTITPSVENNVGATLTKLYNSDVGGFGFNQSVSQAIKAITSRDAEELEEIGITPQQVDQILYYVNSQGIDLDTRFDDAFNVSGDVINTRSADIDDVP